MNHEHAEHQQNLDSLATSGSQTTRNQVPRRNGSRYVDLLLQRLQPQLFQSGNSAVVGVGGFSAGQGVTTLAVNLAIRAADHAFSPTLIVDANHRNTKATRLFRCSGQGLAECINGQAFLNQCLKKTDFPELCALGCGRGRLSRQVADSAVAAEFFKELRSDIAFTVVDLPPLSEPSLAESLLPHLDGVIMVARYGTRKDRLAETNRMIRVGGGKVLAVVMTGNQQKLPAWLPGFLS
jgi:Mrp family chromosome partitioning ATPase